MGQLVPGLELHRKVMWQNHKQIKWCAVLAKLQLSVWRGSPRGGGGVGGGGGVPSEEREGGLPPALPSPSSIHIIITW